MDTFIEDYKKSEYYKKLFETESEIIAIYLGGSYSFKTNHDTSDYDINVITNGGDFISVYLDWHLKYKHKTVH
jgi:predicted nucleotidyltransferase